MQIPSRPVGRNAAARACLVLATVLGACLVGPPASAGVLSSDGTGPVAPNAAASTAGLALLAGPVAPAPVRAAGQPVPQPGRPLPTAIEGTPAYVPQRSCDGATKPGVSRLLAVLQATYPGSRNSGAGTSCSGRAATSEHLEGRALDWGVDVTRPAEKAEADAFLAWLTASNGANARRMGVMYVIWDARIWGTYAPARGWRAITCSGATACHRDHVHISMTWDGAYARTSFWTGKVPAGQDYGPCVLQGRYFAARHLVTARRTTPCPVWRPLVPTDRLFDVLRANAGRNVSLHEQSTAVATAMWILGGEDATGRSTVLTGQELAAFQLRRGLTQTGTLSPQTWRSLADYASGGKVQL